MYFTTEHSIGETVYFCNEAGSTVTRAEVAEIRVTQYRHSTSAAYLVVFGDEAGERTEASMQGDQLHSSASAAFRQWDSDRHALAAPADVPVTA